MKMATRKQREMSSEDESPVSGDLRRGPWTVEEDMLLVNYIAAHGEGRWNSLARCAGLKRTGKSCRLRWLNYLRPDLRRGNMTAQEQLLILELHSRWGNRWSKIAQHLPGRTDNEIKNYWRTRVQKHARQLNCDVDSQQFKDLMRYLWMPRLLERINSSSPSSDVTPPPPPQGLPAAWSGEVALGAPPANNINEVEMSCTTAASSSSSLSTDGVHHHQQQQQPLVVSPPAMVSAGGNDYWPSCSDNNNDTWRHQQPPHTTSTEEYYELVGAAAETCWSDEVPAAGLSTGDMAALPDLGETMWGVDDLWYTQIMGL